MSTPTSSFRRSARHSRALESQSLRPRGALGAPLGLQDAFALLAVEDGSDNPIGVAREHARVAYPHATAIVEVLRTTRNESAVCVALEAATDASFGPCDGRPAHDEPELSRWSAFYVGYAVCWLHLQAITGHGAQ